MSVNEKIALVYPDAKLTTVGNRTQIAATQRRLTDGDNTVVLTAPEPFVVAEGSNPAEAERSLAENKEFGWEANALEDSEPRNVHEAGPPAEYPESIWLLWNDKGFVVQDDGKYEAFESYEAALEYANELYTEVGCGGDPVLSIPVRVLVCPVSSPIRCNQK